MFKNIVSIRKYLFMLLVTAELAVSSSWAAAPLFYPSGAYNDKHISRACWIWYPEKFKDSQQQTRYFRKTFKLDKPVESAKIWIRADDDFNLQVNDHKYNKKECSRDVHNWQSLFSFDMEKVLKTGENTIAVAVKNGSSAAGLICRAEIKMSDGKIIDITSDRSWQVSKKGKQKWETPRVIGDVTSSPWANSDLTPFLTKSELTEYQKNKKITEQRLIAINNALKNEKKLSNRIIYKNARPYIKIGERLVFPFMYHNAHLSPEDPKLIRKINEFRNSGCHLFVIDIDLKKFWVAPGKINMPKLNEELLKVIDIDPDARFMIGINLDPPQWWLKSNPEQWIGYATGESTFKASVFKRKTMASFASEKWKKETGEVLDKVIRYLDNIPTGRRIFAYRLDYGIYSEWHYYGMTRDMPDTGKAMTTEFRLWLKEKYAENVEALRKAWNDKNADFDTAAVPGRKERLSMGMLSLRDPAADQKVIDYQRCHQKALADCQLYFNKIAKQAVDGRILVGNYSGYFFGMAYPAVGWHLETERILNSPVTDFQVSPYCYAPFFRAFGASAQLRSISTAYRLRGKLTILEADTRTHLNEASGQHFAFNPQESVALLARDFCNALINNIGIWYYDFGKNWYNDPQIYQFMRKIKKILKLKADNSSVSEIAVVCDFESVIYHSLEGNPQITYNLLNRNIIEVAHSGVAYDTLLFSDIDRKNVKDYKVYLFVNSFYFTPEKKKLVDKLKKDGKTLVWLYAPGFITSNGLSAQSASELTGIKIKYIPQSTVMRTRFLPTGHVLTKGLAKSFMPRHKKFQISYGPLFYADDKNAVSLGTIEYKGKELDSLVLKKNKDFTSIYCSTPIISRYFLRNIYKMAGIHIYSNDNDDVIYANKSFIAIHARAGGVKRIFLPEKTAIVKQLLPDEKIIGKDIKELKITVPPKSTTLLYLNR